MKNIVETLNTRIALVISFAVVLTSTVAFLDGRHAAADEFEEVIQLIKAENIDRLEYRISDADRKISRIKRVPEDEREQWEEADLIDLEATREYLLRQLDRIQ